MKGVILLRLWSKSSADILCWYIYEFWSYSQDRFARHLNRGWSSKSTRKPNSRCRNGPRMVVSMVVGREGSWEGRELEHV